MNRKITHLLGALLGLVLFLAALWFLHRALSQYHYKDIAGEARSVPPLRVILSLLLTVLNYIVLTGYDALAFRYVGRSLEYGRIAFASFIGYAFSNNIGMSMLAGSSVRYRLYTSWGLSALEVTKMVVFSTLTLWLGLLSVGGIAFVIEPVAFPPLLKLPIVSVRPVGILFLSSAAVYITWSAFSRRPLMIGHREIYFPSAGLSLAQIAVSSLDWLLAGSVLFVLLPHMEPSSLPLFYSIFFLAQTAGLVSQVPGGLGVFETIFLLLYPHGLTTSQLVGALLLYRGIYYLLPLIVSVVMLGAHEVILVKSRVAAMARFMGQGAAAIAPWVLSVMIFAAGALLLFSGATPELSARLAWITKILPLPFLELSHFLGSLCGAALVLLARGIQRRLDAAYHLTVVFLGAGILFSLFKGFDYEEALILAIILGALLPTKRFFYRYASLLGQSFSAGWIMSIVAVLTGSVWLGLFAYRHVEYSQDLWWQFALQGDASRFLRASVGVISLSVIVGIMRLLRPVPLETSAAGGRDLDKARSVIVISKDTRAYLGLLGDKRFLFGESGDSFIMYGVEGRSWIAMGDPVGREEDRKDLVWSFRELCDRKGGWPVIYEAGKNSLYLYVDLGLTSLKIGEEARIYLPDFSLEGSSRKDLRYAHRRAEREGAVFSVMPAADVAALLPGLQDISDAWLAAKNTREKRFSLGNFNDTYLREFPIALVRREGAIIAFSNIWPGAGKEEFSIDLMRYVPGSLDGLMEFLFVELMLWGREQGYRNFNLGMVPLAGLEDRALAPVWNRLGSQIFRHGEHFYNFQGLRQFKEQFNPFWEPKYLVFPRIFLLPRILANLASLISGGLMGAIKK
jgi:phosphatidylglycerol lysyltransferase